MYSHHHSTETVDDDDDDELDNLYSAITLESRAYYTSRALTTEEKKFETSVS